MRLMKTGSLVLLALGLFACSGNRFEGKIIAVSQDPGKEGLEGAGLVLLDPEKAGQEAEVLYGNFHSAASPALSHDARYLAFSARENAGDPWQIWVADLKKNKVSQVTDLKENCSFPAILPDMSIVFTREGECCGTTTGDIWKCGLDGCCLTRLTYNPANNRHAAVLWEGRILFLSSQRYPEEQNPLLMVMKPDGVKAEVYTYGSGDLKPEGQGTEGPDGAVYFISTGDKLSRVMHRRPLHTFELIGKDLKGSFRGVHPCADSSLLVSYKAAGESTFSICSIDPATGDAPEILFREETDLLDPLPIRKIDPRPRILPSAVSPGTPTGLLMVQDINHSGIPVHKGIRGDSLASHIRISNPEGELGLVEAKDDGSVYVKLDADMPFRMETLNSDGEVLRGPSDWIYLRPAERRACTGCHVDPELAPRNYQPHAVKEDPVDLVKTEVESSH